MREHDQPRLHTRLCLWSGLIFALAIPTASRAQDPAAPDVQAANDPIELAARHVQVWETAGERWAILSGEAAVLQAGDGLRAARPSSGSSRFRWRTAKATRPKSTRKARSGSRDRGTATTSGTHRASDP